MYKSITDCRLCGGTGLETVLSFGPTPLADALLKQQQLGQAELIVPLSLLFCPKCTLVQIRETVSPEILFCRDIQEQWSFRPAAGRSAAGQGMI